VKWSIVMNRRDFGRLTAAGAALSVFGVRAQAADWSAVLDAARGQTVYFHAWGGDPKINDFIVWVGAQARQHYGITLSQVKLAATADAVARVLAEQAAGQTTEGAVDLIWINGENFAAMKAKGLLFGPFAETLPNFALVDTMANPATVTDFTLPTEGYESPWAMARLVFEYDSARLSTPPDSMGALLDWARSNPGRFTYPQPPDYLGMTFLKQALYALMPDPMVLQAPFGNGQALAPLWTYLDALHPVLWRKAAAFPANEPSLGQLLADAEIDISLSFNPGRASAEILAGNLADSVRTFVPLGGSIGNASFLAIPFNAAQPAAAQVMADLFLSPKVQARAQDPAILGFQTVLAMDRLTPHDAKIFADLKLGPATLSPAALGPALLEPHASWMTQIGAEWIKRYGVA
jgi:putative thiamine transport system substrate-binding protein